MRFASPMDARVKPEQIKMERENGTATFFLDNRNILGYTSHIPSPEGRCLDRPGHVGRERRPRRSGPARLSRLSGERSRSSRGSPPPPLRHYDRSAQWGLEKCGLETFRRRVGAPVRRTFYSSVLSGAPSPLVPSRSRRPGGGRRVRAHGGRLETCRRARHDGYESTSRAATMSVDDRR